MITETNKSWNYPLEAQHLSGNPKIFGKDIELLRRQALEALYSTGITVEYYRCWYDQRDFYQDPECKWDEKVLIGCIFEDSPKVKTLKDLGWYNEDEEIRAPIIYLPIYKDWRMKDVFDIKENSLVKVHYFGRTSPAEFRITDIKMDSVYGVYWICKLAPERLENFYLITDDGTHYLKRKPDRVDACDHALNDTHEDDRSYQHDDYEKNLMQGIDDYSKLVMGN